MPINMGNGVIFKRGARHIACEPMGRGWVLGGLHKSAILGVGDGRLREAKFVKFDAMLRHFAGQDAGWVGRGLAAHPEMTFGNGDPNPGRQPGQCPA